ncbi:PAS domain-containing protein [Mucilaginibacter sp. RS28]|uniref:PAS domain-containing protein n=1 Tax=Mucilaginibacter straminoryzae TaxID=2932774 RepID=A0A9X1X059_9SPHI|nr:PAS domain-containing protein [Mucilaginibacter straminoryzae]MCJ8208734.1 PAS domain-containing protein [Mucilaginibacter straminoryzae]
MIGELFTRLSIEEQNKMLMSILGAMPQVVLLIDMENCRINYVNSSVYERIGYTPEEVIGMECNVWSNMLHSDDRAEISALEKKCLLLKEGEVSININRWRTKDGCYRWFRNHIVSFRRNERDRNKVVLAISRDITPIVESQNDVVELIENIEKVSFKLSHELRHEHSKIQGVINLSQEQVSLTTKELVMLAGAIKDSTQKIDESIIGINSKLTTIKNEFLKVSLGLDASNY